MCSRHIQLPVSGHTCHPRPHWHAAQPEYKLCQHHRIYPPGPCSQQPGQPARRKPSGPPAGCRLQGASICAGALSVHAHVSPASLIAPSQVRCLHAWVSGHDHVPTESLSSIRMGESPKKQRAQPLQSAAVCHVWFLHMRSCHCVLCIDGDRHSPCMMSKAEPAQPAYGRDRRQICAACRTPSARPTPPPSLANPLPGSRTHLECPRTSSLEAPTCPSTRVHRSCPTGDLLLSWRHSPLASCSLPVSHISLHRSCLWTCLCQAIRRCVLQRL